MRSPGAWWGAVLVVFSLSIAPLQAGELDTGLAEWLAALPADESVSTLVLLKDRVDLAALEQEFQANHTPLAQRHETVVRALRAKAAATQGALNDELKRLTANGQVDHFEAYWITNAYRVDAPVTTIRTLATHPAVDLVFYNYEIELIEPTAVEPDGPSTRAAEAGLSAIHVPDAWAMGFTGEGVLVATLDTGVDGAHPALASRWAGLLPAYAGHPEWAYYDPFTDLTFPNDENGHGTHTMGTACGGAPGDQVGVAPGATWIHAAVIDRGGLSQTVTDAISAFQWLIDPDGDPTTNWDVPAVCSNSWGIGTWHNVPPYSDPCDSSFWSYVDACEAAGIVVVFAAGNEGPTPNSLRRPADRATDAYRSCAIGGVNANLSGMPMYSSSSRGPTYCSPSEAAAIKPDLTAPGEAVRSALPDGSYGTLSGTSMAAPHVNGTIALMREACPTLSVEEIKDALYQTAVDLGDAGKDNNYGWGVIDASAAVELAEVMCGPSAPHAYNDNYETPVNTPLVITLRAIDPDGGPNAIRCIIKALSAQPLYDAGDGHRILPAELPYELSAGGREVIYSPAGGFCGNDQFTFVATDGGAPPDGGESAPATVQMLVLFDAPDITTTALPPGCVGHTYGPNYLTASAGQPPLTWRLVTNEYLEEDLGASQFAEVGVAQGWKADDNAWVLDLPFSFPFFGMNYTNCWVASNGYIDFGGYDSDYSNSESELAINTRIAPLWDDLRTDRLGADIYVDAQPDQVTIRWRAIAYNSGSVVNVSVVLHMTGIVELHYGSGNADITPTVGISAGDGLHYHVSMHSNANNLGNVNSVAFLVPPQLPAGVALTTGGLLLGTPTEAGAFTARLEVVDSLGRFDRSNLVLTTASGCVDVRGDTNCDGVTDLFDVESFALALANPLGYTAAFPTCNRGNADVNADGAVNAFDIDPFVVLLGD